SATPIRSPISGTKPMSASMPTVRLVPGIGIELSSSQASWRSLSRVSRTSADSTDSTRPAASTEMMRSWPAMGIRSSIDADVRRLDDLRPAREVGLHLRGELVGRVADRLYPERGIALFDEIRFQDHGKLALQALDHRPRRRRRREDAGPRGDVEALEARLAEGRHLGQRARALRLRHAERHHPAR